MEHDQTFQQRVSNAKQDQVACIRDPIYQVEETAGLLTNVFSKMTDHFSSFEAELNKLESSEKD